MTVLAWGLQTFVLENQGFSLVLRTVPMKIGKILENRKPVHRVSTSHYKINNFVSMLIYRLVVTAALEKKANKKK